MHAAHVCRVIEDTTQPHVPGLAVRLAAVLIVPQAHIPEEEIAIPWPQPVVVTVLEVVPAVVAVVAVAAGSTTAIDTSY